MKNIPGKISITFNAWTSKAYDPYLSVIAYYINALAKNPSEWELKSKILGFMEIEGNHSGANTAAVILWLVDHYNIYKKVF